MDLPARYSDFEEMSNLNKNLRAMLIEIAKLKRLKLHTFKKRATALLSLHLPLKVVRKLNLFGSQKLTVQCCVITGRLRARGTFTWAQQGFNRNLSVRKLLVRYA